ncbi:hypothetical protein B0A54_07165 [Friedmanniomyces endolithicus]|uniref:Uncharacterized protein n=1 Tax=Friedmanniomyces endolithicus TaxID=329885 RepID=A0A4V5N8J9_9PEZI|nr:hypothetical protein LTR54_002720 [Friedmanniomyces endolithicus]TKA42949.1 hypothetical protein B0A54_07165 [Friedmanniomyces endolithicus]
MAQPTPLTPAQANRLFGKEPRCIAVIHPPNHINEPLAYVVVPTETLQLQDSAWQPLPLVFRLGIDILYAKPGSSDHPVFTCEGGTNATLAVLTTDCDPKSASFGLSARTADGAVAFKYPDPRQQLAKGVLQPLETFITEGLMRIKTAMNGPTGIAGAREEYVKLTPQAFKTVWKAYRAEQAVLHPGMGWRKLKCPVTLSRTSCEACGREADASVL